MCAGSCGFSVRLGTKVANSVVTVFAKITAPAARSRATTAESRAATIPSSASEPAVVGIRSAVARLSFTTTGMPCSGPRSLPALRSRSRSAAIDTASGLVSISACNLGPWRSLASMRDR